MLFKVWRMSWLFSFCALIAQVLKLNGILPLVALLRSPSVEVNQTASAALRSLSFKNNNNKEEIHRCSGVTEAVNLLRDTESAEVQKQLTGTRLLWLSLCKFITPVSANKVFAADHPLLILLLGARNGDLQAPLSFYRLLPNWCKSSFNFGAEIVLFPWD